MIRATCFEPFQYSEGISHVRVNGQFVLDQEKPTATKPGRILPRQRTARRP